MPRRPSASLPTGAELEILNVLWDQGSCTVGGVREELLQSRKIGYTSVLKMLQVMNQKGLVKRNEKQRAHVYRARYKKEHTQELLVDQLVGGAFGGSAAALVRHVLLNWKCTPEELAEIRKLMRQ